MYRKKGIILLVTIFFITTISILILQNLQDTDMFLDELSYDKSSIQMQISIKNVKDEIPKFLRKLKKDYKDEFDTMIKKPIILPLKIQNSNINILLNIEKLNDKQKAKIKCDFKIKIDKLISNSSLIFDLVKTPKSKDKFQIVNIFQK